ncbi:MAG: hypothetical protein ACPGUE_12020 [Marinomonas sp.]
MSQSSIAACNAGLNARNALFNGGSVEIRSGAAADIDAAPTGTVLVTFTLPNPAFGAAATRIATMNAVTAVTATVANAGGAVHYVARDSGSAVVGNGTAGTSGTDMILNTLTWGIGDDVSITAWSTTQPK